jgi:hypothetical protein
MKMRNLFMACLIALAPATVGAEQTIKSAPAAEAPGLTKFNLDFPGGTPRELVAAIERATGKPLNAIIPTDQATVKLPPLKMNNVDAAHLFKALMLASIKQVSYETGKTYGGFGGPTTTYVTSNTAYGFKTEGEPTDNSVWYFFEDKPALPPNTGLSPERTCRFYPLTSYLDRGLTVDDITTAIQTGWKMLGEKETPTISFHKETKLLIAVGEPGKLKTIDAVLMVLESPQAKSVVDPTTGLPLPAEKPKAKN